MAAQEFGHAPRLKGTTTRQQRVPAEDLGNVADARLPDMASQALKGSASFPDLATRQQQFQVRGQRPGPDGALVVGGITQHLRTTVISPVARVMRRQGVQAQWGQQFGLGLPNGGFNLLGGGGRVGQGQR